MTLLNQPQYNRPRIFRNKWTWYAFGVFTLFLVVLNFLETKTEFGQSSRILEYNDNMKLPASRADSATILSLYDQLNAVYVQINSMNFDSLKMFNNVKKAALPKDFYSKLITYDLLDYVFDTSAHRQPDDRFQSPYGYDSFFDEINSTMGNGNFNYDFSQRKFHKGFAGDARYLLRDKYIMVLIDYDVVMPSANEGTETFESGQYYGGIMVFDITTTEFAGYDFFVTSNSAEVLSGPMKKDYVDHTLFEDLEKNVTIHVNQLSTNFFGQSLWPKNYK